MQFIELFYPISSLYLESNALHELQYVKGVEGKNNSVQHKTRSMLHYYLFLWLSQQWLKELMTHARKNFDGRNVIYRELVLVV